MHVDTSRVDDSALEDRFFAKVNMDGQIVGHLDTQCHEWTACVNGGGYGNFKLNGKMMLSHRVAWFLQTGEWPQELLLHACDNPPCVRFEHLREGTQTDNMQDRLTRGRAVWRNPTHCPAGHEYTFENTYIRPDGLSKDCRMCRRIRNRLAGSKYRKAA